jgi:hypothetical protein
MPAALTCSFSSSFTNSGLSTRQLAQPESNTFQLPATLCAHASCPHLQLLQLLKTLGAQHTAADETTILSDFSCQPQSSLRSCQLPSPATSAAPETLGLSTQQLAQPR